MTSLPLQSETLPDACTEDLVSFPVGEAALRVFGVIHRPPGKPDPLQPPVFGVVLLGGWSGTRVGPHGILVAMAREFAAAGLPVLRFDFRGRGDSEGTQDEAHIGTMVEDSRAAAAFLSAQTGVQRVLLLGICAGAQVAMAAAPGITNLAGLVLWSPPPFHPDSIQEDQPTAAGEDKAPAIRTRRSAGPHHGTAMLREYGRKLFDSRTWAKLAHGQLQPRTIFRILTGREVRGPSKGKNALAEMTSSESWAGPKPDEALYEKALIALDTPALFIFGGNDPERPEATEYYLRLRDGYRSSTGIQVVPGSNHAFYSLDWKSEVIRQTLSWVRATCDGFST